MKAHLQFILGVSVLLTPILALAQVIEYKIREKESIDFSVDSAKNKHFLMIESELSKSDVFASETISKPPARKKVIFLLKDYQAQKKERVKKTKELYNSIMLANTPESARQENFIKSNKSDYRFLPKTKAEKYHDVPKFVYDMSAVASVKYQVEHDLIISVIKKESWFDPNAKNESSGASGLMQLMPGTANDLGVTSIFDPEQNIDGGVRYLRWLLDRYNGNYRLALAAYNAGYAVVDGFKDVPQYKDTTEFVDTVMRYYTEYKTN